jgi:hypothetical protein
MDNLYSQSGECVSDIHKQTNQRIYSRNIPSQMLQPYIDVRPVMTKYSYFPIVDPRKNISTPLQQMPTYNVHEVFNPGNTQSPFSGFATNINVESELRNQIYALQKCSQAVFVPSSNSDLYNYNFTPKSTPQTHSLLFQNQGFAQFNPNPDEKIVGADMFMNSTRVQVRDMTKQKC